ncbi:MAG: hypothetical protein U5N86_11050 [Planctomycetota bacterium]|nr:hypothetical protein [Planctomycetota bacterium]
MTQKDSKFNPNCPCPSDCKRRGYCADCIAFHHGRGELTYCEYVRRQAKAPSASAKSGREIRLLDYGPCAG